MAGHLPGSSFSPHLLPPFCKSPCVQTWGLSPMSKLAGAPPLHPRKQVLCPPHRPRVAYTCGTVHWEDRPRSWEWAQDASGREFQIPGGHVPLAPSTPHLAGRSGAGGRQRGTLHNRVQSRGRAAQVCGLPCLSFYQPFPPRPSGQASGSQQPDHGGYSHLSICLLPAQLRSPQTLLPASADPEKYGVLRPPT